MSAEQGDVEMIRPWLEHIRDSGYPAQGDIALFALDRLAAALERAERLREGYYVDAQQQRERAEKAEQERDRFLAGNQKLVDGQIRLAKRAERAERALAENKQAWEDMRAYNIRLEERAREAERALADESPCEQRLDEEISAHIKTEERAREAERALADIADGSWGRKAQQVNYDVQEFARAALRPSEDTSDES